MAITPFRGLLRLRCRRPACHCKHEVNTVGPEAVEQELNRIVGRHPQARRVLHGLDVGLEDLLKLRVAEHDPAVLPVQRRERVAVARTDGRQLANDGITGPEELAHVVQLAGSEVWQLGEGTGVGEREVPPLVDLDLVPDLVEARELRTLVTRGRGHHVTAVAVSVLQGVGDEPRHGVAAEVLVVNEKAAFDVEGVAALLHRLCRPDFHHRKKRDEAVDAPLDGQLNLYHMHFPYQTAHLRQ